MSDSVYHWPIERSYLDISINHIAYPDKKARVPLGARVPQVWILEPLVIVIWPKD